MSDSIYTPKSNKKFREKDGVTSCEPTILRRIGIGPHCEPTILQIRDLEIQISESLPRWRGKFFFLPPYATTGIQIHVSGVAQIRDLLNPPIVQKQADWKSVSCSTHAAIFDGR